MQTCKSSIFDRSDATVDQIQGPQTIPKSKERVPW